MYEESSYTLSEVEEKIQQLITAEPDYYLDNRKAVITAVTTNTLYLKTRY